ncbi:MAG TPA: YceI family protein, partial [Solirubrobacteraceae bacterium]
VAAWSATLRVDPDPAAGSLELTADSHSLLVREGSGGVMALDEDDKAGIAQTIAEEVLQGGRIAFTSSRVSARPGGLDVEGDLDILGTRRPQAFTVEIDDAGRLSGRAAVKQTDHGMKPYTALFGTLKVQDEIEITVEGTLPTRKDVDG